MKLLKWYCAVVFAGALALARRFYPDAYRWYGQFEPGTMEAARIHWSMFMDWSSTASYVSPYVLGLTFLIGLLELVRSQARSALLLAPSVSLFAVGIVLSVAELVTWYVGSSIGDTSVYLAVDNLFMMVGTELVATLVLGGLLFAGAIVKLKRAAEPALAGRPRGSASSARPNSTAGHSSVPPLRHHLSAAEAPSVVPRSNLSPLLAAAAIAAAAVASVLVLCLGVALLIAADIAAEPADDFPSGSAELAILAPVTALYLFYFAVAYLFSRTSSHPGKVLAAGAALVGAILALWFMGAPYETVREVWLMLALAWVVVPGALMAGSAVLYGLAFRSASRARHNSPLQVDKEGRRVRSEPGSA